MENEDKVNVELQKQLDKQAVGFPATQSGVEIRILKHFFDPEEASLALHLNYQPQSAQDIHNSIKGTDISLTKVKSTLEEMARKGAIGTMERNHTEYYFTMPLLVGMVEWNSRSTPQFRADLGEYMNSGFRKVYGSTRVSQMRTIPVGKSVKVEHHVTTYDDIREIINGTEGPILVARCMCREGAHRRGQPCHTTSRSETCMAFGDWARYFIKYSRGREVTREEALNIMRLNEEDGLVLQPTNYQNIDFVCACCGCCCGILNIQKMMPKPAITWAHNYYASVDTELCTTCGTCVDRCQVNAAKLDENNAYSTINLDRCIGCGNCVVSCPSEALKLVKKEKETVPPEDCTSLYKILAEKKI